MCRLHLGATPVARRTLLITRPRRTARELYEQGAASCSLDFAGGPGSCASAETASGAQRNGAFYAMKEELEKKARELGGKVAAPNVQLFKSKKDFEAFHLKKPREA